MSPDPVVAETAEPIQPVQPELTEAQLADFAKLLAKTVTPGNIAWLGTSVLGNDVLREAANEVGDVSAFARRIVDALASAGRISDAVALLHKDAHRNGYLCFGLKRILRGEALDNNEALQKFVNEYEPFLSSGDFQERFPRVLRTVCAIGLGNPIHEITGSGFLIGPDLVMTNYHVIETFLKVEPDGETVLADGPGNEIFCFFDYLWMPTPKVPPETARPTSFYVQAADDWLIHARKALAYDGTARRSEHVDKEYDYAVIRLKRPVGKLPSHLSGGAVRGWLPLRDEVDVLGGTKRIIVFQHPQKAPQQFDVGDFVKLEPSGTRVWYSVSTAHGSSGGAAVDSTFQLFALHNAEVEDQASSQRLNQGVRIDLISKDLAKCPKWVAPPAFDEEALAYWSLNDDLRNPQPIIGRTQFRENVYAMSSETGERLMVVTGTPGSGRRFSIKLLRHTLGPQTPVVVFSPKSLQIFSPRDFLRFLVGQLNLTGLADKPMPDPQDTETLSRWLREDLPRWLRDRLDEDPTQGRIRYPAWIVIDTVMDEGEYLLWADNLKDFVAALAGFHDPGQTSVDLPQLRWLFLGHTAEDLPVRGVRPQDEDLSNFSTYQQDLAECLQTAWRSVEKQPIPVTMLYSLATSYGLDGDGKPSRKALATLVRTLFFNAPSAGGQP